MATDSSTYVLDSKSFRTTTASTSATLRSSVDRNADDVVVLCCRHCSSPRLITDWKAGDVVCTDCGSVAEDHIRDASCEWRVFNKDADDDPNPLAARCGMVPNDETRWVGGLEPTTLSSNVFGGRSCFAASTSSAKSTDNGSSSEVLLNPAKKLKRVHLKIHKLLEKAHKESMRDVDLTRKLILKRWEERKEQQRQQQTQVTPMKDEEEHNNTMILLDMNEMEAKHFMQDTMSSTEVEESKRWSLERAIQLHKYELNHYDDLDDIYRQKPPSFLDVKKPQDDTDDISKLSSTEKRHLRDLYTIYQLVHNGSAQLGLPTTLVAAIMKTTCHYATITNGLRYSNRTDITEGISSNYITSTFSSNQQQQHYDMNSDTTDKETKKDTTTSLLIPKLQQLGSLASAIIYIHTKRGQVMESTARSITQVCSALNDQCYQEMRQQQQQQQQASVLFSSATDMKSKDFVTPKSCSKALAKIKLHIPDLFYVPAKTTATITTTTTTPSTMAHCPISSNSSSTSNTSISLPPTSLKNPIPQTVTSATSTTTPTTESTSLIVELQQPYAAAANLVPHSTGTVLQLPKEATYMIQHLALLLGKEQMQLGTGAGIRPTIIATAVTHLICSAGSIMQRLAQQSIRKTTNRSSSVQTSSSSSSSNLRKRKLIPTSSTRSGSSNCKIEDTLQPTSNAQKDMLDLLLPAAGEYSFLEKPVHEEEAKLQGWYEWKRQGSWDRDYKSIENAFCGKMMKPGIAYEYYRVHVFPRRASLLNSANEALLSPSYNCNQMTSISTAAPLMVLGKRI